MRNINSNIIKGTLFVTTMIFITSCSSSPSGENVLMDTLNRSKTEQNLKPNIKQGKPIYYKAYAYPQILSSGDIWGGGEVFVEMGREKFDLNSLINK